MLYGQDATLPDLIAAEEEPKWAAVWVINAANRVLEDVMLVSPAGDGANLTSGPVSLAPLSVRKVPVQLDGRIESEAEQAARTVQLVRRGAEEPEVLSELALQLQVAEPGELHVRTFVSEIDGSVQPYAVQPGRTESEERPGLILSLHGAAVDARSHAGQYAPKSWAHVVAPTNRRPFGFDWEEWGRIDALEALQDAQSRLNIDPRRVYLTGHSMGGHGAWHLGTLFPGRFAAVGTSAGWVSFETYARTGEPAADSPIGRIFAKAASPGNPLVLKTNLASRGVYVLHGGEDENVPVGEARRMREALGGFHTDFAYFEKAGAGHWWGSECVDWPPMMNFFQRHELPAAKQVARIDFTTLHPGISARSGWVTIEAQDRQLEPSRVVLDCDVQERSFTGTTSNVARLALDVSHLEPESTVRIELDNQRLRDVRWPNVTRTIWMTKEGTRWRAAATPPSPDVKSPERYGLFKSVFQNRPVLVYGTRGNDAEDQWALAKARFDAETFLYRGNGALDVIADAEFDPSAAVDRNVVLYGNADTNGAWPALLSTCPVQVRRGAVRVGQRSELGDDLGCVFIYPRRESSRASVGVVSGTGLVGMQATSRLRYFVSGVSYPDLVVFDAGVLREGARAIRAAGFFGLDWQVESGEIVWRDLAL
jgi:pimeloyl-ACP methyl ester carboxylesterase